MAGRRALLVGVSEYVSTDVKDLDYAHKDAQALFDFLRTPQGGDFKQHELRLLVNAYATLEGIRSSVANFVSEASEDDPVLLFFCGHGMAEQHRPQNVYFMTHDSRPDALYGTAFPMWELWTSIQRFVFSKRVTVLIDCCRAGAFGVDASVREATGVGSGAGRGVQEYWAQVSNSTPGLSIITATDADTSGYEHSKWGGGHGVFTHCLLEALSGKAQLLDGRFVTAKRAFAYVFEEVRKETGNRQRPWASAHLDDSIPLSLVPASSPNTSAFSLEPEGQQGVESRYELHFQAGYRFATDAERCSEIGRAQTLWQKAQREISLALSHRDTDEAQNLLVEVRQQLAVVRGEQLEAAGQLRQAQEAFEEALLHREGETIRSRLSAVEQRLHVEELITDGKNRHAVGDYVGALNALSKAKELGDSPGLDALISAVTVAQEKERVKREGERLLSELRSASANSDWSRVLALAESNPQRGITTKAKPILAEARFQLALQHRKEADKASSRKVWPEAVRYYELAIEDLQMLKKLGRSEYQLMGLCYGGLADVYKGSGDYQQGFAFLQRAVEAKDKALSLGQGDSQSLGVSLHALGVLCRDHPDLGPALPWYLRAVEAKEAALGDGKGSRASLAVTCHAIGIAYRTAKNVDSAVEWFEKAARSREQALDQGHDVAVYLAISYFELGATLALKKDHDQSLAWYMKAFHTEAPLLDAGKVSRQSHALTCRGISYAMYALKDYEHASEWALKATELDEASRDNGEQGYTEYTLAVHYGWLSRCEDALGHLPLAIHYGEQAVEILRRLNHSDLKGVQARINALQKAAQAGGA